MNPSPMMTTTPPQAWKLFFLAARAAFHQVYSPLFALFFWQDEILFMHPCLDVTSSEITFDGRFKLPTSLEGVARADIMAGTMS